MERGFLAQVCRRSNSARSLWGFVGLLLGCLFIIFFFLVFRLFHLNTEQPLRRRDVGCDLFESFVLFGFGILDFISCASSYQFHEETLIEHDPATSRGSLLRDANFFLFFSLCYSLILEMARLTANSMYLFFVKRCHHIMDYLDTSYHSCFLLLRSFNSLPFSSHFC